MRNMLFFIIKTLISFDKLIARKFDYRMHIFKTMWFDILITRLVQMVIGVLFVSVIILILFYFDNPTWRSLLCILFSGCFFIFTGLIKDALLNKYKRWYCKNKR